MLPQAAASGHKAKYKCNFYNNTDLAYVPASGLSDFVDNFTKHMPKTPKRVSVDILMPLLNNVV